MATKKRIDRVHRNRRPTFLAGDKYDIDNTITRQDVNKDGVSDLVVDHVVKRNKELFYTSQSVWYGIDDETYGLFEKNVTPFLDDFSTTNLGELIAYWKKMTKVFEGITAFGAAKAAEIGQPVSEI